MVWTVRLLGEALRKTDFQNGPIDVKRIAAALETSSVMTPTGPWSIRKADHQGIIPVAITEVSDDVRYPVDDTPLGFKPVRVIPGADAAVPVDPACKMDRPAGF